MASVNGPEAKRRRLPPSKVTSGACFTMGLKTHTIPMSMYSDNRAKLISLIQETEELGVALFKGAATEERHDSDRELIVRQESYFAYLFGVTEPDFYGALDLRSGHTTLFIPRLPAEYAVWMGKIQPPEHIRKKYDVDEVRFVDEIHDVLAAAKKVHVMHGQNTDSKSWFARFTVEGVEAHKYETNLLFSAAREARVCKSADEIAVLRYVAKVSSAAHVKVMQSVRPLMAEYQLEAIFQHHVYYYGGCRQLAYTCICATGPNSAVLHYGHAAAPNERILHDGDMALLDMGGEYACYCADITCSYPVNGKFTADQRIVYNAVLAAQQAVFAALRPGVEWTAMHQLAERTILASLAAAELLTGDVDTMMAHHLGAVFMPHGLGHLLGLDTHDVGGFPPGRERAQAPGLKSLRMNRQLEEGMVLTVEPGCYFIDHLLDEAMSSETTKGFFVADKINRFRGFGGVRLEDDVMITVNGMENFTICPRTVEDVERVMAGSPWPPEPVVKV